LQPLALYPADSMFVDGYLTTPGQPAPEVWQMIADLGFTIEVQYSRSDVHEEPVTTRRSGIV
jgi:biotin synthase